MKLRRTLQAAIVISFLLIVAAVALARSVSNSWSGQWATDLGGGTTGNVYFAVISADKGASQIQAMGGHPCTAPTTYYHGYYTDTGNGGENGNMTACTASSTELVGRYVNSNTMLTYPGGNLDITLNSSQDAFSGYFTADDPSFSGMQFPYSGTFQSDFQGDGCCATATTTTTTTASAVISPPPPPPTKFGVAFKGRGFNPAAVTVASGAEITICNTGQTYTSIFSVRSTAAKDSTLVEGVAPDHTREWRLPHKGHKLLAPGNCGSFKVNNPTSKPIELHLFSEIQSRAKLVIVIQPASQ